MESVSHQQCLDCRAEALTPMLFRSILDTCKGILKSPEFVCQNDSSNIDVQNSPHASLDSDHVDKQQEAEIGKDKRTTPEIVAEDRKGVEERTDRKKIILKVYPRTRPGCATCKKRRVKCDEARPICQNCTRSRRECGGYAPRLYQAGSIDIANASLEGHHGSTDANPLKHASYTLGSSLPGQAVSEISSDSTERHPRCVRLSGSIEKKRQLESSPVKDSQNTDAHRCVKSAVVGITDTDPITRSDISAERPTLNHSQIAPSGILTSSDPSTQNTCKSRRLLGIVTSLLLFENVIEPQAVRVVTECDHDLYEVVVHLLLEFASQLFELDSSAESGSWRMILQVNLIKEAPPFERASSWHLQKGRAPSQNDVLSEIERIVGLLMDLTTTIQDILDDVDDYFVMLQPHASANCVKHISIETGANPAQEPSLPTSSGLATRSGMMPSRVVPIEPSSGDDNDSLLFAPPTIWTPFPPKERDFDTTGQLCPPGITPRVTITLWEDQSTLCFQVDVMEVVVGRREDNHFINGSSLMRVAARMRGQGIRSLKSENCQHVVKTGPAHLRGIWIPYERALEFANSEVITEILYPLFAYRIEDYVHNAQNTKPRLVADEIFMKQADLGSLGIPSNLSTGIGPTDAALSPMSQWEAEYMHVSSDSLLKRERRAPTLVESLYRKLIAGLGGQCASCKRRKRKCDRSHLVADDSE